MLSKRWSLILLFSVSEASSSQVVYACQAPRGFPLELSHMAIGLSSRCHGSRRASLKLLCIAYGTAFLGVWCVKGRVQPSQGLELGRHILTKYTSLIKNSHLHHYQQPSSNVASPPVFSVFSHLLPQKSCRFFKAWKKYDLQCHLVITDCFSKEF